MAKTGIDRDVNIYQLSGTIVPLQDTQKHPVVKVEDLSSVPFTLSVSLDET